MHTSLQDLANSQPAKIIRIDVKIGVISQKGGVGKSTITRLLAREYSSNKWNVLIADMDISQATSTNWQRRRCELDVLPYISSQQFSHVHQVKKHVENYDMDLIYN